MSPATVTCPRCRGTGEVVARSRSVGGGAVNDDYDTCPNCHGNGYVKAPEATAESEGLSTKVRIYFSYRSGFEDSIVLEADTEEELKSLVDAELARRGATYTGWAEL